MEYLEGVLLSDHLKRRQAPMEPQEAVRLVRKLAQVMEAAHQQGIIHRDLKPSNIMMDQEAGPIVMDFGLARREDREESLRTRAGQQLGTPAYMPLEQFQGKSGEHRSPQRRLQPGGDPLRTPDRAAAVRGERVRDPREAAEIGSAGSVVDPPGTGHGAG